MMLISELQYVTNRPVHDSLIIFVQILTHTSLKVTLKRVSTPKANNHFFSDLSLNFLTTPLLGDQVGLKN